MKVLDGSELAGYIKAQQAREVRSLVQSKQIQPRLAIVQDNATPLNSTYARLKQSYADDIGVQCGLITTDTTQLKKSIEQLNSDDTLHGLILQLPIADPKQTDEVVQIIKPSIDIDGLGPHSQFDSAAATAILWLLSGYNVSLTGKEAAVVGQGRLVGKPVSDMLESAEANVARYDEHTQDLGGKLLNADIIISAVGQPGLLLSKMVKQGAVIVDAGTASDGGTIVGDAAEELYERDDLTITPKKGGVGPLTVAALFGNLLRSARMVG